MAHSSTYKSETNTINQEMIFIRNAHKGVVLFVIVFSRTSALILASLLFEYTIKTTCM